MLYILDVEKYLRILGLALESSRLTLDALKNPAVWMEGVGLFRVEQLARLWVCFNFSPEQDAVA